MRPFFNFFTSYIVPASTLLPIGAGFIYFNKLNKPLKALLAYLLMAFIMNVIGTTMAHYDINNLPALHLYTLLEAVFILLYYRYAFDSPVVNRWTTICIIFFSTACIINALFFQSIYEFNTNTRPVGALMIIIFSAAYLAYQNSIPNRELVTSSGRIVAGGFLLYFCSAIFQFIFTEALRHTTPRSIRIMIWDIHAALVFIMYMIFLIAIIRHGRSQR
ncbi:hypothetical protein MUY27_13495 [Mucilaginibacter sp. RS28]|uniref:Uncharacterized protein n=1 Tax=Mucilaginibacter straminoryzae TaxID=2932774 RepID=A0A9X1X543_9SPHI|nr:hypothetical protein [Mucilaginibacter straminoryzae]MCJ8210726.1 hypothetical protein [Mucilaginibacter straminoryzae]